MANRIEFSVSCTPIVSVAAGENVAVDTIAKDMQKSLGGSGAVSSGETNPSVTVDFAATGGYGGGVVDYKNVNTSATTTTLIVMQEAVGINLDFVIVKHTGYLYSGTTTLGIATTMAVDIYVAAEPIGCLRPGEALLLPLRGKSISTLGARLQSGTIGVAIEMFATT